MGANLTDLTGKLAISLEATAKRSVDLAVPTAILAMAKTLRFAFGTAADQADEIWWDRRILAHSTLDSLDLTALTGPFGAASFAVIKGLVVINRSNEVLGAHDPATSVPITVGATDSTWQGPFNTVAKGILVPAGGPFLIADPSAAGWVVNGNNLLKIGNGDGADEALYDIALIGEAT